MARRPRPWAGAAAGQHQDSRERRRLGNPLRFILTGGQQHDITQAEELIAGYAGEHVLADQGYDAQEFASTSWNWV